jgi:hypothetical protein
VSTVFSQEFGLFPSFISLHSGYWSI